MKTTPPLDDTKKGNMKKIIVLCLTISVIIGAYGHTKNNSKQSYVTVEIGSTAERNPDVAGKTTDTTVAAVPSAKDLVVSNKQGIFNEQDRPSDYQIIAGKKNGPILWKIYALESSRGKHDGCKSQGKFNGFGFGQSTHAWNCFDYFEEVVFKVDDWFEKQLDTKTLAEALCYYNEGIVKSDCGYYRKYLSL